MALPRLKNGRKRPTDAVYERAVALEDAYGATLRTPGRDAWPTALKDLFANFDDGKVPELSLNRMKRERMAAGGCRVCAL